LIQSAKRDKSSEDLKLTHDEFKDLIFSKDEALNVNLKSLKPTSDGDAIKIIDNVESGNQSHE
jgi:hypothetical protein